MKKNSKSKNHEWQKTTWGGQGFGYVCKNCGKILGLKFEPKNSCFLKINKNEKTF